MGNHKTRLLWVNVATAFGFVYISQQNSGIFNYRVKYFYYYFVIGYNKENKRE